MGEGEEGVEAVVSDFFTMNPILIFFFFFWGGRGGRGVGG